MRFLLIASLFATLISRATTTLPLSEEAEWRAADAVCRGRVESVKCHADQVTGRIMTRAVIVVAEALRGQLPERVAVEYRGGALAGQGEDVGDSPALRPGEERLFFMEKSRDGTRLTLSRGAVAARKLERQASGEITIDEVLRLRRYQRWQRADPSPLDLTPLAVGADRSPSGAPGATSSSGLLIDTENGSLLPARWTGPDRGEPIAYIIDDTIRPPGISRAQGLAAVQNALAAWSAVTGVKFRFEGYQDFGDSADNVFIEDEKIRIQLHDTWGAIDGFGVTAIGGRAWNSTDGTLSQSGGGGGQVNGLEFHKTVRGYVVLLHSAPLFSNPKAMEEVLCHELGHVFGLAHSSNNPTEPNVALKQAMMYYTVHNDNRGATLGTYDPPMIQKAHPPANTPPWAYARYVTAHTGASPQTALGVNETTLNGYDLQTPTASLTFTRTAATGTLGTFAFTGTRARFTPSGNSPDAAIPNPLTSFYVKLLYRFGDGVNCSPWQPLSVFRIRRDTFPNAGGQYGDGMPDSWMTANFGNTNPAAGPNRGANDDFDKDGFTNLAEYRLGTNPLTGGSTFGLTILPDHSLQWLAQPWSHYVIESSTNGIAWQFYKGIVPPAAAATTSAPHDPALPRRFLRMRHMQ